MGYNTSVIILNDSLHVIEKDKDFGEKVGDAARRIWLQGHPPHGIDISSCGHGNVATVVETHHADYTALLAFGGNCVTQLGFVAAYRHNTDEVQVELLRMFAGTLGYKIVKDKP